MNPYPAWIVLAAAIAFCGVWAAVHGRHDFTVHDDELSDAELFDAHHADAERSRRIRIAAHSVADAQPVDTLPDDTVFTTDDVADLDALLEFERSGDWVDLYRDNYRRARLEHRDGTADDHDLTPLRDRP